MKNLFLLISFICLFTPGFSQSNPSDSCICEPLVKPLSPEKCQPVKDSYGTSAVENIKYFVRVELLTNMPLSRPEGFSAYKISWAERRAGYWAVGYGIFDTVHEAELMAENIRQDFPEFCKAFAMQIPRYDIRIVYELNQTGINDSFKNTK